MTQRYHARRRIALLIVLVALIVVIGRNLFSGSTRRMSEERSVPGYSRGISSGIISLASEADDFGWRPLIRFFR